MEIFLNITGFKPTIFIHYILCNEKKLFILITVYKREYIPLPGPPALNILPPPKIVLRRELTTISKVEKTTSRINLSIKSHLNENLKQYKHFSFQVFQYDNYLPLQLIDQ